MRTLLAYFCANSFALIPHCVAHLRAHCPLRCRGAARSRRPPPGCACQSAARPAEWDARKNVRNKDFVLLSAAVAVDLRVVIGNADGMAAAGEAT